MNHEPWCGIREELRQSRIAWASAFPPDLVCAVISMLALIAFLMGVEQ